MSEMITCKQTVKQRMWWYKRWNCTRGTKNWDNRIRFKKEHKSYTFIKRKKIEKQKKDTKKQLDSSNEKIEKYKSEISKLQSDIS